MFHLALVRSGLNLTYSRGFNPRAKFSVAFARSVGLAGDNEILDVCLSCFQEDADEDKVKQILSKQLPSDITIKEVVLSPDRPSSQATGAEYEIPLGTQTDKKEIERRIKAIMVSEEHFVERTINAMGEKRTVEIRNFISSMEVKGDKVVVKTKMTPAGTIRVDEICSLLYLSDLEGDVAVTRTQIYLKA